jgi:hypothetical protein
MAMAEVAFVCLGAVIPRSLGGLGRNDLGSTGDHACGVGDDFGDVVRTDEVVESATRQTGGAGAGFEVADEVAPGEEGAFAKWAFDGFGDVDGRIKVLQKICVNVTR